MILLSKGYLNMSHQCMFDTGQGKAVNEKTCCAAASVQSLWGRQTDRQAMLLDKSSLSKQIGFLPS